jgi:hypothetical protein
MFSTTISWQNTEDDMAPRRSRPLDEPMDTEKSFDNTEEHQILQRISTLESDIKSNDAQCRQLFASDDSRIRALEGDVRSLNDAHQQSEGGRAMRIAIASAIGFAMSVAAFLLAIHFGNVTP